MSLETKQATGSVMEQVTGSVDLVRIVYHPEVMYKEITYL